MIDYNIARDIIKNRLTLEEIITFYLGRPAYNHRWICPIHNGKNHNLGVNGKRTWKCYKCGANGDEIQFVMQSFNLSYCDAIIKIVNDFNIPIGNADTKEIERQIKLREEQRKKDLERANAMKIYENKLYDFLLKLRDKYSIVLEKLSKQNLGIESSYNYITNFIKAKKNLATIELYISILICEQLRGDNELLYPATTREELEQRKIDFLRNCYKGNINLKALV